MSGEEVLSKARAELLKVDSILLARSASHGSASRQIEMAARLISVVLGAEVSALKTCLILAAVKLSRELSCDKANPDHLRDLIGYTALASAIRKEGK